MALQIPKQYLPTLVKIRQLSEDSSNRLCELLSSAELTPDPDELVKKIAPVLAELQSDDLRDIVRAIYALHHVREVSEVHPSRFLSDLIQALKSTPEVGLSSKDTVALFRARLKSFLAIENIGLISKALTLQRDGERLYCEAKILSDIRSVFREDAGARPAGAVLGHTLKLSYHEGKDHKEFFVVLERSDLAALKNVIERAQTKEATLRQLLSEAGIRDLSI